MITTFEIIYKNARDKFNKIVLDATFKAQQKYGFEIGTGPHSTWNNEADAFKHAYMQWLLGYYGGDIIAIGLGNFHENETPNAPKGERNMDLWNNSIGREIAQELKKNPEYNNKSAEEKSEIASRIIVEKMRNGELITSPDDKRIFNEETGEREPAPNEKLKDYFNEVTNDSRIFSFEDVINIPQEEAYFYQEALDYQYGKIGFPKEKELQKSPHITKVPPFTYSDGSVSRAHYRSIGGNKFINPAKPSITTPSMEKNRIDNYIDKVFKKNSPIFEHYEKPKTYRWETNKGACKACQNLDNKEFESKEDIPPKPHPNCKCKVEKIGNKEISQNDRLKNLQDNFYKESVLSKRDITRAKEYYQIALTNGEAIDTVYPVNIKTTVGQLKDMNLRNHVSQIKSVNNNSMVVIPKQNARIINQIKKSKEFKKVINELLKTNSIKLGNNSKVTRLDYISKNPFKYGINASDLALTIGHAHLYNTHFDEQGNLYTTLVDWYDFDKIHEKDIFDRINNNAYEQQERGDLTNYVLVIPIVLTKTEVDNL